MTKIRPSWWKRDLTERYVITSLKTDMIFDL